MAMKIKTRREKARPEGFEPPTPGSEAQCSVQLSYGRALVEVSASNLSTRWR